MRQMVLSVLVVQSVVLAVGAAAIFVQTRSAVAGSVADQIQLGNTVVAEDLGERMRAVLDGAIRPGNENWRHAQSMIERAGVGTMSSAFLLDSSGRVVCHPDLVHDGGVLGTEVGSWTVHPNNGAAATSLSAGASATGRLEAPLGGAWYVTTRPVPELGVTIVVHTPESALAAMTSSAMRGAWLALAAAGAGLLALTVVGAGLVSSRYERRLARVSGELNAEVERRVEQGLELRNALIFGLAKLADYRDSDTGKHLERIAVYTELIAHELAPAYPEINDTWIERVRLASSMDRTRAACVVAARHREGWHSRCDPAQAGQAHAGRAAADGGALEVRRRHADRDP